MTRLRKFLPGILVVLLTITLIIPVSYAADEATAAGPMNQIASFLENSQQPVDWLTLKRAIEKLGALQAKESKPLLIEVLQHKEALNLAPGVALPGVMSPLNMLKAAAIDALTAMEAKDSIPVIKTVADTEANSVLGPMAKEALQKLEADE